MQRERYTTKQLIEKLREARLEFSRARKGSKHSDRSVKWYCHQYFMALLNRYVRKDEIKFFGQDEECRGYASVGKGNIKRMCRAWTVVNRVALTHVIFGLAAEVVASIYPSPMVCATCSVISASRSFRVRA